MSDLYLTPDSLPTFGQRISLRVLGLFGWRIKFAPLPGPRGVLIVYPHTSNWDFMVGIFTKWALAIPFHWIAKESLFTGLCGAILGPFFRAWGGEPIARNASTGAINRLAQRINAADFYWLVITPEGTRKYRDYWPSGFYHIALTAGVPLGMAAFDYAKKEVRLVDYATLTGDQETDLQRIREAFDSCRGLRAECAGPIRFNPEKQEQPAQEAKRA